MSLADECNTLSDKILALEQENETNEIIIAQQREIIAELKSKPNESTYLLQIADEIRKIRPTLMTYYDRLPDYLQNILRLHDLWGKERGESDVSENETVL